MIVENKIFNAIDPEYKTDNFENNYDYRFVTFIRVNVKVRFSV